MVSAAASQQEGRGFDSGARACDLSVWSLHVLPVSAWVLSGFSGFLPQSKNMHVRSIEHSKLSVGVHVSVNGCLFLCGPAMNWRLVQGVTLPSP